MKNLFENLYQETGYIFRLDDIAPNMRWDVMNRVKILFDEYKISHVTTYC